MNHGLDIILSLIVVMIVWLAFCVIIINKRVEGLEKRAKGTSRRQAIARMLATSMITPTEARQLLYRIDCTCEDLTTPAYPEFAAMIWDDNCPIHGKKKDDGLGGIEGE